MKLQLVTVVVAIGLLTEAAHARTLQQSFSSAVSVSGGEGPFGNCGSTQVVGTGSAFASGPPCPAPGAPATPSPPPAPVLPPSTTCPATIVPIDWAADKTYAPLTLCPGSTASFRWNTASATVLYGLYQIPSSTCPAAASDTGVQLIITPASSPNPTGAVNATISEEGTFYFTDIANCAKGQLQEIIISPTPVAAAGRKL